MSSIGSRIRAEREARGWTRAELSQLSGVSESHLVKIELENRNISAQLLIIFSRLFEVEPLWLAMEEGPKIGAFLSDKEVKLLDVYRKVPEHLQDQLLKVVVSIVATLPS